jgi:hypothetical protein
MDYIVLTNLTLCIIIVILGSLEYSKTKSHVALCITIAFGLFGISHLFTLLGFAGSLVIPLIIVRFAAYLTIIYALYINIARRKDNSNGPR